jgi:4-amino-4-deoxy-L-arabinose transferase-like glycosyltransferase
MKKTARGLLGWQAVCHALVLVAIFAFQAINLDSDPSPLVEKYQFNDEGYWNHAARCRVLFGTFVPDEFNQDIIASPLFTLIQWGVFSVAHVSIWSARIQPLVSLWLTLLMVYFLMRRYASANAALLAVAMLGLLHEMLMYTKWSTPIITQACLLTAILWFWERGKAGSRWWMAACGAALVAAVLTTLLAGHCLPGIALFIVVAWLVRKEVDWKGVAMFLGVALLLGIVAVVAYYLPNWEQVKIFWISVGQANLHNDPRGGRPTSGSRCKRCPSWSFSARPACFR